MNALVLSICMLLGAVPPTVPRTVDVKLAAFGGKWINPLAANPLFQAAIRSLQVHTEQVDGGPMVVIEARSRVSTEFPLTLGTDWSGDVPLDQIRLEARNLSKSPVRIARCYSVPPTARWSPRGPRR